MNMARSFTEILGGFGMDDFLATRSIGAGRTLNIASLSRNTIEDCGASHMGFDGFFLFEAADLPDCKGITILGKAVSFESAMAMADLLSA
jgi:hypothetical protein